MLTAPVAAPEAHRLDHQSNGLDSRIKLDGFDPAFLRAELLHQVTCVIECVRKLREPTRPLCRGILIRYSNHKRPPGRTDTHCTPSVSFALHMLRSGAEIV